MYGLMQTGSSTSSSSSYPTLLAQSQSTYNDTLSGYQNALSSQMAAQQPIMQGYNQLQNQVMGTIQGIDQSQQTAINDAYAQQIGQGTQSLVNAGLGNSTVTSQVARGLTYDQQKAQTGLANQFAQLSAGYQSQLGLAGLNYQNQANMQNTALQAQQFGFQGQYANALLQPQATSATSSQMGIPPQGGGGFNGGMGGGNSNFGAMGPQQYGGSTGTGNNNPYAVPADPLISIGGPGPTDPNFNAAANYAAGNGGYPGNTPGGAGAYGNWAGAGGLDNAGYGSGSGASYGYDFGSGGMSA